MAGGLLVILSLAAGVAAGVAGGEDAPAPAPPASPQKGAPADEDAKPVSGFLFRTDPRVKHEVDLALLRNGSDRRDPKDYIPAIRKPVAVPRLEAVHVDDDDAVVGVELDGEARAYPLRQLEAHEIVNDVLGGIEIAVTYCPLCDSAVVYRRRLPAGKGVPEEPVVFGCSGWLLESDVLIYDDRTETFWQQLTGRGVIGPLTGTELPQVPLVRTTMKAWQAAHPKTTVLSWRTEHAYQMSKYRGNHYAGYRVSKQTAFPVSARDPRLPLKASVHGLVVGGSPVAVPDELLVGRAEPLSFSVGDTEARVALSEPAGSAKVQVREKSADGVAGPWREAQALRCYWFAWFAFHKDTRVVAADGTVGPPSVASTPAAPVPAKEPGK